MSYIWHFRKGNDSKIGDNRVAKIWVEAMTTRREKEGKGRERGFFARKTFCQKGGRKKRESL